jgi:hypothetical protein
VYQSDIQAYQATKDVSASYDAVVDLLETVEHFLNRLEVYIKLPIDTMAVLGEIIVKMLAELLSTLALVTKQIRQKRPCECVLATTLGHLIEYRAVKFVKKLLGENEVEAVLQRLERLTVEEAHMAATQTLGVVHGLVQNMRAVMDGEATPSGLLVVRC